MTKTTILPALFAALALAAPATAFAQAYETTGSQSIDVGNLSTADARAKIEIAARKVCRPSSLGMEDVRAARDCYRRAKASAEAQLAQLQQTTTANAPALAAVEPRNLRGGN